MSVDVYLFRALHKLIDLVLTLGNKYSSLFLNLKKAPVLESLFNKVAGPKAYNFIKKIPPTQALS